MTTKQTYNFDVEIPSLMSTIVQSVYSSKDYSIRELISNASDALDKVCITNSAINIADLKITVSVQDTTLIIEDNGIGMSKDDLINFLGKIASSGTKAFKANQFVDKSSAQKLIGQFGLGFYSAFLIADSVSVVTKKLGEERAHLFVSNGSADYSIEECEFEGLSGTRIVLSVKKGCESYLRVENVEKLIKKYSLFIGYPIYILKEVFVESNDDNNDDASNKAVNDDASKVMEIDEPTNEAVDSNKEAAMEIDDNKDVNIEEIKEETKQQKKPQKKHEMILINKEKPLWHKKPKDCTKEEYTSFYKTISNDWDDFLSVKHLTLEGLINLTLLLFIPKKAKNNLFEKTEKKNIKLYVQNVFVTDDLKDSIPDWMNCIVGVISSDDLPMNVSREFLQGTNTFKMIKNNLSKKVVEMFEELSADEEKYGVFLKEFGVNLKMAVRENTGAQQERIGKLLRYYSSKSVDKMISLDDYIIKNSNTDGLNNLNTDGNNNCTDANNNETNNETNNEANNNNNETNNKRKIIYVLTGLNKDEVMKSPFLNLYKNSEVLFMYEPVDEIMLQGFNKYKDWEIKRITSEISDEGIINEQKYETFISDYKKEMEESIEKIILRDLGDSPCVISTSAYGFSAAMENMLKAQPGAENNPFLMMMGRSKKILQINPNHKIIQKMIRMHEAKNENWKKMGSVIFEVALVECGYKIDNGVVFAKKMFDFLSADSGSFDGDIVEEKVEEIRGDEVL